MKSWLRMSNMDKLERYSRPDEKTGCCLWTGAVSNGYGIMRTGHGETRKLELAHRVAYREQKGPIPKGMLVLHSCDNPACVAIDHLFLGTHGDNIADKMAKGRQARGEQVGRSGAHHWHYGISKKSKLTASQVRAIRASKGVSGAALARQYGVSAGHINRIIKNQRR